MRIDGTEITPRQFKVDMYSGAVNSPTIWKNGKIVPFLLGARFGMKTLNLVLRYDGGKAEANSAFGNVIKKLDGGIHLLEFDGIEHAFRGILTGSKISQVVMERRYDLTLTMTGQEVGEEITVNKSFYNGSETFTIENPGNDYTAARVEMWNFYTLEGEDPQVIRGLIRNPISLQTGDITKRGHLAEAVSSNIVIDGVSGVVLWHDTEPYEYSLEETDATYQPDTRAKVQKLTTMEKLSAPGLPILAPGENEVEFIHNGSDHTPGMSISFRPVYL